MGQQNTTPKIIPNNTNFSNQIQTVGVVINKAPAGVPVLNQPPPSIPVVHPPAPIAVMTSDKRIYSKKLEGQLDFSVPPPGKTQLRLSNVKIKIAWVIVEYRSYYCRFYSQLKMKISYSGHLSSWSLLFTY